MKQTERSPPLLGLAVGVAATSFGHPQTRLFIAPPPAGGAFGIQAVAACSADFDNDGRGDMAIVNVPSYSVRIIFSRGPNEYVARDNPGLVVGDYPWLEAHDFDGDGDADLAQLVPGSSVISLLFNTGGGSFPYSASRVATAPSDSTCIAYGDVDRDGDVDALVGTRSSAALLLNDGRGNLTNAAGRLPVLNSVARAVSLVDVDGDGDLDYVHHGTINQIWLNDGFGFFPTDASAGYPPFKSTHSEFVFGDVDGDFDLDVIGNLPTELCLNDGSGRFSAAPAGRMPTWNGASLILADFNGDRAPDLAFANAGYQNQLWLNNGRGTFTNTTSNLLPFDTLHTTRLMASDIDGDGDRDMYVANRNPFYLKPAPAAAMLNDGSAKFAFVTDVSADQPLPFIKEKSHGFVFFDGNGDGFLDMIVARNSGQQNAFYVDDGFGRFLDATAQYLPADTDHTNAIALADLDGQGGPELITVNWLAPHLRILTWTGSKFVHFGEYALPRKQGNALSIGDIDGDKDLDIVVGHYDDRNSVLLNDGSGKFQDVTSTHIWPIFAKTTQVELVDIDRDGDLDLIEVSGSQHVQLYRNVGGKLTDATTQIVVGAVPTCIAPFDADRDGDVDFFVGTATGKDIVLENLGANFQEIALPKPVSVPNSSDTTTRAIAIDIDGDGDSDIFSSADPVQYWNPRYINGRDRWWRNDGLAGFKVIEIETQGSEFSDLTTAIAVVDTDGDGDPEYIVNSYDDYPRLFRNRHRQTETLGQAAVGRKFYLGAFSINYSLVEESFGGAGFLSLGTTRIDLPPLGLLRLDPATLVSFWNPVTVRGEHYIELSVPNDQNLVGQSIYFQALMAGRDGQQNLALRFTNAVKTTIVR